MPNARYVMIASSDPVTGGHEGHEQPHAAQAEEKHGWQPHEQIHRLPPKGLSGFRTQPVDRVHRRNRATPCRTSSQRSCVPWDGGGCRLNDRAMQDEREAEASDLSRVVPTARHLCRTPGTSGHRPPGASGAHCAVLDPFILQRRRPAHRRFARKFRRGLVACFLPKDAMTPKLSRDTSMHGDAVSLRRPAPCERVDVETRLFDLAINDTEAELLVVLRGTVRPWGGPGRGLWRVQLED